MMRTARNSAVFVSQGYLRRPDKNKYHQFHRSRSGAHEVGDSYHALSCTDKHINQP
jgi:hypothetical protein